MNLQKYCSALRMKYETIFRIIVLLLCGVGLFLGQYVASLTGTNTSSMMRSAMDCRMSIVGLFVMLILPFVITTILIRISVFPLVFLLVLCKSFIFSFCCCSLAIAYGSAGWLARWLLVFSDSLALPVYLLFCLRNITRSGERVRKEAIISVFTVSVIGCIDYLMISPFVANLF